MLATVFLLKTSTTRTTLKLVPFLPYTFYFSWLLVPKSLTSAVLTDFKIFTTFSGLGLATGGPERHPSPGTNQSPSLPWAFHRESALQPGIPRHRKEQHTSASHHGHCSPYAAAFHLASRAQLRSRAPFPGGNEATHLPQSTSSLQPEDQPSTDRSLRGRHSPTGARSTGGGDGAKHPNCSSPAAHDSKVLGCTFR